MQSRAQLARPVFAEALSRVQDALDRIVPEGHHYRHLDEGLDDMPAHVKVCQDSNYVSVRLLSVLTLRHCMLCLASLSTCLVCSPRSWAQA